MIYTPDAGLLADLDILFNNSWPTSKDLTLKLYCNNVTITDSTAAGDFTEATGGGYADKTLTNGSWTVSNSGGIPTAVYAEQVFTFTGSLDTNLVVYGYYVVDDDGLLKWAEPFTTPCSPVSSGNHIDITPKFQKSKGTPS